MRKCKYQENEFLQNVGAAIKTYRELKELRMTDVGAPSDISHIEKGHVDSKISTLKKIADAMDEPLWHIFLEAEGG